MSNFSDLLAKPLPSKVNNGKITPYNNGVDNEINGDDYPEVSPSAPIEEPERDEDYDLDADAEQRIDQTINAVATPLLLSDSMTDEEYAEFTESAESDILMSESYITERTVIRFDKNARKAQLYEVAVAACARENNDRLYKKLQTVYKMERILKAKLRKKYDAKAKKKVREYLARAKKSKSGVLSRIASKLFHGNK